LWRVSQELPGEALSSLLSDHSEICSEEKDGSVKPQGSLQSAELGEEEGHVPLLSPWTPFLWW